jgi:hypothetical protein
MQAVGGCGECLGWISQKVNGKDLLVATVHDHDGGYGNHDVERMRGD